MMGLGKSLVSLVKSNGHHVGDAEMLAAEIAATTQEIASALAEADRLDAASQAELDDGTAEEMGARARSQRRAVRRAEQRVAELREKRALAVWRNKQRSFAEHKSALEAAARQVIDAVEAAAAANAAAVKTFEAARREFGHVAERLMPQVHFAGLLFPDLVAMWRREVERDLATLARRELPPPAAPPAAAITPIAAKPAPPLADIGGSGANRGMPPIKVVIAPPSRPPRERNADDLGPLLAGEVRCRVSNAGFSPRNDLPQCDRAQVIRMPRAAAKRAAARGAIEIIEEHSETVGVSAG
jgi:hypothetical protein